GPTAPPAGAPTGTAARDPGAGPGPPGVPGTARRRGTRRRRHPGGARLRHDRDRRCRPRPAAPGRRPGTRDRRVHARGVGGGPAVGVGVAGNGAAGPRSAWAATELRDGDAVEVLTAVQGG